MKIHLVDGTYELFRNYYGAPPKKAPDGREAGAALGLLRSLVALLGQPEVTHVAYAFDHVIESFRNDLYPGYKTGEGIDPDLWNQFQIAEDLVAAAGVAVWPMVEFEADDAMAAGATRWKDEKSVEQILLCSPDKDLAQMVSGTRVVGWDRRRDIVLDEEGVFRKFGVTPQSIPDYLALVGDSADGYPGIPGWGAKSASGVLSKFVHLEFIPEDVRTWGIKGMAPGRAASLAANLEQHREDALLFRRLATLRTDVPLAENLGDLEWRGALPELTELCTDLGDSSIPERVTAWQ
ncbi:MAG TPA: 5'-3' exonuclease H3TH domain-containing protein [Anaerolineales bacterium]|jgi:5'-3' exonuclease|nr:5'-3' exonuclease H3TH domain-containing protein [Anaerolineales bacterium]